MKKNIHGWLIPLVTSVYITLFGAIIYACLAIGHFQGKTQTQISNLKDQQTDLKQFIIQHIQTKR